MLILICYKENHEWTPSTSSMKTNKTEGIHPEEWNIILQLNGYEQSLDSMKILISSLRWPIKTLPQEFLKCSCFSEPRSWNLAKVLYFTFATHAAAAAAAKSFQSCPTPCDPIDGSPPGSPVPGILQARTLEWVAISFSSAWKWKVKVKSLSPVRLLATPWTAAHQAPQSMGFCRQEYWSGVPLPSPHIDE